jgi:phenylpropionate dioxygenase-like ring-hydroxylating dioxygenase large terminal subunit
MPGYGRGIAVKYDITGPGDLSLAPGQARNPGRSHQEVIRGESSARDAGLSAERYEFLGDEDVPFSRYTSQAFYDLEIRHLWPRTWQWACRVEHIPRVGDYTVYDVGPYSALVVRGEDQKIRAFVNSCPHRGMQFANAGSSGSGKQFIRCPFHGMSWTLDGALREIPCRWDFPHVTDDNFGLIELPCDTWAGFVFVNFDREAGPLHEFLEVLPEHFKNWGLEDRYVAIHTSKVLPGNWKMCMEAFLEAFHVLATHRGNMKNGGAGWANAQYDIFGKNVTRFIHGPTGQEGQSEQEIYAMFGNRPEDLRPGMTAREQIADAARVSEGKALGTDLSKVPASIMLDSIEYHLFPNACFFPGIRIPLVYRFRPLGLDRTLHEILIMKPAPDSGPRPPPAPVTKLDIDESYTTVEGFFLGQVLDEDTENFHRQWAGMNAAFKTGQTLGNYQEARIRRFQKTLLEYLPG